VKLKEYLASPPVFCKPELGIVTPRAEVVWLPNEPLLCKFTKAKNSMVRQLMNVSLKVMRQGRE